MTFLLTLLIGVGVLGWLVSLGLPVMAYTAIFGASVVICHGLGVISTVGWILYPLAIAWLVGVQIPLGRQKWLTPTLFSFFKQRLPKISATEQAALDAGDTWWEAKLLQGAPDWKQYTQSSFKGLSPRETDFIHQQVETLCEMLDDWATVHHQMDLSEEVWAYLKKERFFGMGISTQYSGLGFSALAHSCIIAKIATRSMSAAITTMVPNSLGPAELLIKYGTQTQKEHYLPKLATGQEIPCFALTSSVAGSDAGAIQDQGIVCQGHFGGQQVVGIRLNWDKRYITLAPVATVLGLAFKLYDPEHLLGQKDALGITLALIPTDHPGVDTGQRHFPLNMAFLNGPTRGKDVFIPLEWIIGGPKRIGQGWRMLMDCLSEGRGISLPALSAGASMVAYRMTGAYALLRKQFKTSIGHFEGVQEKLARIGGYSYAIEAMRVMAAGAIGQHLKPSVVTAISKYHMTEMARTVVNDAMDIHAGKGIMLGPNNYLGRLYQSIPICITVEGANILTRSLMIYGQGAIRCHPFLMREIEAFKLGAQDLKKGIKAFDRVLVAHVGYFLKNAVKSVCLSLSQGRWARPVLNEPLDSYIKPLNWFSTLLATVTDVSLLMLGGHLKRKEQLSGRLGDVLSHLYMGMSVVKYYCDQGKPQEDWPFVQWVLQSCLNRIQQAFKGIFQNFPVPGVGHAMSVAFLTFKWSCDPPSDELSQQVAQGVMQNGDLRKRLTQFCFVSQQKTQGTRGVEHAFEQMAVILPLETRIQQAIRNGTLNPTPCVQTLVAAAQEAQVISAQEANTLIDFYLAQDEAIQVDEFLNDELKGNCAPCKDPIEAAQIG